MNELEKENKEFNRKGGEKIKMWDKTYMDKKGYFRFKDSNKLVHRWIAHKNIYKKNKEKYNLPFGKYLVHHKDGHKLHNNVDNLELIEKYKHHFHHGHLFKALFCYLFKR